MKKTKIVCTIGPATAEVETIKRLIKAGMNVARINFSHGSYAEQERFVEAVKQARKELNLPVALLLDTQGPEIRTGKLEQNPTELKAGDYITLTPNQLMGNSDIVSISYADLAKDVEVGTKILVDDGKIELKVETIQGDDLYCKIMNGGMLGNRKSINVPKAHINLPALKEKDIQDLIDGCKADFDFIAASFVRNADDVKAIREVLDANGGKDIKIISKIENQEGIDNFAEILKVSDGIMVARGDLGVEIPVEMVPVMQKKFIKDCQKAGKIVITATQMLESMTEKPRPTRAEVSDVANAVYDITSAIMLSGESAQGKYPVECVELMSKIANAVEKHLHYDKRFESVDCREYDSNYEFKLNHAACATALQIGAKAMVAYTETGDTPSILSGFLNGLPIYAITSNEKTYRQLALTWGVCPVLVRENMKPDETISKGIDILKEVKALKEGDIVIIAGGASILNNRTDSIMNRTMGGALKI